MYSDKILMELNESDYQISDHVNGHWNNSFCFINKYTIQSAIFINNDDKHEVNKLIT